LKIDTFNSVEVVNLYLQKGQTLKSVGKKYGVNAKTIRQTIELLADMELKTKAYIKLKSFGTEKTPVISGMWDTINKKVTRRQLIDWWINIGGKDTMTVKELIKTAENNGIVVKGY
jgi:hypothetical protein